MRGGGAIVCNTSTQTVAKLFIYREIKLLLLVHSMLKQTFDLKLDFCPYIFFCIIGIFESPKCDVNPQPNTRGIGPLVGRTSGNRRSVMHVLAVIFSITYHVFFICQYIFIQVILSGREIYPLLMYPSTFLVF